MVEPSLPLGPAVNLAWKTARSEALRHDPGESAARCGFLYEDKEGKGEFAFDFLGFPVVLDYPAFTAVFADRDRPIPDFVTAFFLYHLARAEGSPLAGSWISYAELPGGTAYIEAFRRYTSELLVKAFGNDLGRVRENTQALGLKELFLPADLSFVFEVLPKVNVAFLYRRGDEEFPPDASLLFDASAPSQLPSDCYAVLGSWLTGSLIKGEYFFR